MSTGLRTAFTKSAYPWTNGQVERLHPTLKKVTVRRRDCQTTTEFNEHLQAFLLPYDHAK